MSRGCFGLRGDLVPDYRLLNYPVAWLATEQASALDGTPGNVTRLVSELDELGIVDRRLSFYMPLRLREFGQMGFSGFEGAILQPVSNVSAGHGPGREPAAAAADGRLPFGAERDMTAEDIPDDPTSESERRTPFFFAAAGLPAFYVHKKSRNELLKQILPHCKSTRSSWRHPDYLRVPIREYREALVTWLEQNAPRNDRPGRGRSDHHGVAVPARRKGITGTPADPGRRVRGVGRPRSDAGWMPREFNRMAEQHYRETLRSANLREAFDN